MWEEQFMRLELICFVIKSSLFLLVNGQQTLKVRHCRSGLYLYLSHNSYLLVLFSEDHFCNQILNCLTRTEKFRTFWCVYEERLWEILKLISCADLGNVTTWNTLHNKSVSVDSDVLSSWTIQLPSYQAEVCVTFCMEWVSTIMSKRKICFCFGLL